MSNARKGRRLSRRSRPAPRPWSRTPVVLGLIAVVAVAAAVAHALLGGDGAGDAAPPAAWTDEQYTGGPRLAVDRTVADYGAVSYDHEVAATFRLKNVGDAPLVMHEATIAALEGC